MPYLAVRAHFEVTSATAFLLKKLRGFYDGSITFEELDQTLCRLSLGAKIPELERAPDPINVLSMIDAADDLFRRMGGDGTPMFRKTYDWLSDVNGKYFWTNFGK